ncbi:TetR/AcrR family transcriptional regulator [Rhizobium sp. CG5]|uniref:TetR/AcrR family transcriptional regulator n=1 Tax=Rhizobium sp. CG5 TaxID=2726076 RepID=UPI0020336F96|nr:TetR/AcrR family transcriptional regulator [Rhizobium sp. CG5]MCM2472082.1 TetR/AcrR family transcriptional regulator [Rhizobium sp. CG5]
MSSQEKSHERINQKRRTRAELLRATWAMMEKGLQPSVAEVADHTGISRATAYRYFSKPEDLWREAALDAIAIRIGEAGPDAPDQAATPEQRIETLAGQVFDMVAGNEAMFRTFLASSLTATGAAKRGGRRIGWLTAALEPLRSQLTPAEFQRLIQGLSLTLGIEALIVFRDICELTTEEARSATIWSALAILRGALADGKS